MSISWQRGVKPEPAILVLPPGVDSLDEAHAAIELWEFYSRKQLDSTQRLTVEVMMAESGGRWAARTTGREMPRQNGKGDELEVVEFWGIVQRAEAILHTAHELTTVSSAHQRMAALIEGHPDMRRRKKKILNGIGQQMIEMTNGGVIAYRTRTNGGGRGLDDISRLVVDEAQHAKPEQLASSTPILLANPNPQTNFAGTGAISGVSDWWWELRKRALGKNPGAFGYVGHTAEKVTVDDDGNVRQEPVDPSDRKNWWASNPALHVGRGELEFFAEQLRTLGPALFGREHCGVWDPPGGVNGGRVISTEAWRAAGDSPDGVYLAPRQVLTWDVSPTSSWAAVGWVGERGDVLHGEIVESKSGVDWVAARVAEYVKNSNGVVVAVGYVGGTPAEALVADVVKACKDVGAELVDGKDGNLIKISQSSFAAGCVEWLNKTTAGTLRHVRQDWLTSAVDGAVWRNVGETRVFDRRNATAEITPLCCVTAGLRVLELAPVKVESWVFR